jgi:hypothetical protein
LKQGRDKDEVSCTMEDKVIKVIKEKVSSVAEGYN